MDTPLTSSSALQILPVSIPAGSGYLRGDFILPHRAEGLVIFIRAGSKDRDFLQDFRTARMFGRSRLASLLVNLPSLPQGGADMLALSDMLHEIVLWTRRQPQMAGLPVGCLGTGIGAAIALMVAARPDRPVQAVVSRNGRPDLAAASLPRVGVPILMIVSKDKELMRINEAARDKIAGPTAFNVISHASPSFDEPGALEEAAQLAGLWFMEHMAGVAA